MKPKKVHFKEEDRRGEACQRERSYDIEGDDQISFQDDQFEVQDSEVADCRSRYTFDCGSAAGVQVEPKVKNTKE